MNAANGMPPARGLGALLIAEALLSFAPVAILGRAIGWPASLRKPAAEQLAAIGAAREAVAFGYGLHLLYSLLVAPVLIVLAARALGGLQRPRRWRPSPRCRRWHAPSASCAG